MYTLNIISISLQPRHKLSIIVTLCIDFMFIHNTYVSNVPTYLDMIRLIWTLQWMTVANFMQATLASDSLNRLGYSLSVQEVQSIPFKMSGLFSEEGLRGMTWNEWKWDIFPLHKSLNSLLSLTRDFFLIP